MVTAAPSNSGAYMMVPAEMSVANKRIRLTAMQFQLLTNQYAVTQDEKDGTVMNHGTSAVVASFPEHEHGIAVEKRSPVQPCCS